MAALLLVDDEVRQYEKIVAAAKPTTVVVVFDKITSTLDDIINQVKALSPPNQVFTQVGLVQDGTDLMVDYQIVNSQTPCNLFNLETDGLGSWAPIIEFLKSLQTLTGLKRFDFISCLLDRNPAFDYATTQIGKDLGIIVAAAKDRLGNTAQGGTWLVDDGVNIADVYFTDEIVGYTGLLVNLIADAGTASYQIVTAANPYYAMVGANSCNVLGITYSPAGYVSVWGDKSSGGTPTYNLGGSLSNTTLSNCTGIITNGGGFAALSNGQVYVWGYNGYGGSPTYLSGGNISNVGITNCKTIAASPQAFAALTSNGQIYVWGDPGFGGSPTYNSGGNVSNVGISDCTAIAATNGAFAALSNGQIYVWGTPTRGGSPTYNSGGSVTNLGITNCAAIAANLNAFAALTSNGQIYVWGSPTFGGSPTYNSGGSIANLGVSNCTAIVNNGYAFAALSNGQIYNWGFNQRGGSPFYASGGSVTNLGLTNCAVIAATPTAFAALTSNGQINVWGDPASGGSPSYNSGGSLANVGISNCTAITATNGAFAALSNGQIYVWGNPMSGGSPTYNSGGSATNLGLTNCAAIAATLTSFAALTSNGQIYVWGNPAAGGSPTYNSGGSLANLGVSNCTSISPNGNAFTALSNGQVYVWGNPNWGGSPTLGSGGNLSNLGLTTCTAILGNYAAFAAITSNPQIAVPSPPTINSVTPGLLQATVNFTPVTSSPPVTSYTITTSNTVTTQVVTSNVASSPTTITGLQGGLTNFTMTATNSQGTSAPSATVQATVVSLAITVVTTPTPNNALVYFQLNNGTPPTASYLITATNTGTSQQLITSVSSSPGSFNLPAGNYTLTVAYSTYTSASFGPISITQLLSPPTNTSISLLSPNSAFFNFTPPMVYALTLTYYTFQASNTITNTVVSSNSLVGNNYNMMGLPVGPTDFTISETYTVPTSSGNVSQTSAKSSPVRESVYSAPDKPPGTPVATFIPPNSASVSFQNSLNSNYAAILTYSAYNAATNDEVGSVSAGTNTIPISGLSVGAYSFYVKANSYGGLSPASSNTNTINVAAVPSQPASITATGILNGAQISFTGSALSNGSAITQYLITGQPGNFSSNVPAPTTITVSPLTPLSNYTFYVAASNAAGVSSSNSASVTIPSVPSAPQTVSAAFSDVVPTTGIITFTNSASSNGFAITRYIATSVPAGFSGFTTNTNQISVSGLQTGSNYTFNVQASNAAGLSISAATNSITIPTLPGAPTINSNAVSVTANTANVTFSPPANTGGIPILSYTIYGYLSNNPSVPAVTYNVLANSL